VADSSSTPIPFSTLHLPKTLDPSPLIFLLAETLAPTNQTLPCHNQFERERESSDRQRTVATNKRLRPSGVVRKHGGAAKTKGARGHDRDCGQHHQVHCKSTVFVRRRPVSDGDQRRRMESQAAARPSRNPKPELNPRHPN